MAARKRHAQLKPLAEFDTCKFYVQAAAAPAFTHPKRVLLRHVFFMDEDSTKYVSVGIHPARDYQPLVEFGAVKGNKTTFLVHADQHVSTMAEIVPRMCEAMCGNEQYGQKDGDFRLNTTGGRGVFRVARMYEHNEYFTLMLAKL